MAERLPRITARELVQALRQDGWEVVGGRRHDVLRHPTKRGRVVVPRHASVTLKPGTLAGILKDAGLSVADLRRLL